jgi:hypothetical protein
MTGGYYDAQLLLLVRGKTMNFISLFILFSTFLSGSSVNPLKSKMQRERVRKDSIRVEVKRKHLGESERSFISGGGGEKASC